MTTKAVKRISIELNHSIGQIVFAIGDKTLVFHAERAKGTRDQAALFGWARKISNEAALSRDENGQPADDATKLAVMADMVTHLETGTDQWSPNRVAGRATSGDIALLVTALMELQPTKERAELTAWVKSKSPAERAALMVNPKVKTIVDRLRTALASEVDADGLLDELNDM